MLEAKKHFSQNFLVDQKARQRVVEAMHSICQNDLPIIEIGPGAGDVTKYILEWQKPTIALEIDADAVEYLQQTLPDQTHLDLRLTDAWKEIKTDQNPNLPKTFNLLSSLPYHIGSRIVVDLATTYPHINFAVILQQEVIQKTQPNEANNNFGIFGAWLNIFWDCQYMFDLPPHCFMPQPKVHSALMIGKSRNKQLDPDFDTYQKRVYAKNILKKLFSYPSKNLNNNCKALGWEKEQVDKFFEINNLDKKNYRLNWANYQYILQKIIEFEKCK